MFLTFLFCAFVTFQIYGGITPHFVKLAIPKDHPANETLFHASKILHPYNMFSPKASKTARNTKGENQTLTNLAQREIWACES